MSSNMQNWNGQFNQMGGGGGMQNMQSNQMGQFGQLGGGGMPSFANFQNWGQQQRLGAQDQYQVGQNGPIDSNAGFRTDPNANYTAVNPYGMNQSNQNSWTGNGWTSNRGTPVPSNQLGGPNLPPRGQSERPQQQWNPGPNTGMQTPYQMPGGQGQISTHPGGIAPWDIEPPRGQPSQIQPGTRPPGQGDPNWNNGWGTSGPPNVDPRPRPRRPPQGAFGQQNPTVFNQNFANTPAGRQQMQQPTTGLQQGFGRGNIQNPYQQQGQNRGF